MLKRVVVILLVEASVLTMLPGIAGARAFPMNEDASAAPPSVAQKKPKVYHAGDRGIKPPKVIFNLGPPGTMPPIAGGREESVVLEIVVGVAGDVIDVKAVHGNEGLSMKAADVIKTWKFEPAKKKGIPVPCALNVAFYFRLK